MDILQENITSKERFSWQLSIDQLPLLLTLITLIGLVGGRIAEGQSAVLLETVLYSLGYIAGGYEGLKASLASLRERTIDVDLLMILAAVGAAIVGEPFEGVLLLFLFSLSNVLQEFALDRTRNAIRSLMALRPSQAMVERNGHLLTIPIEQISVGETIIVKPGTSIPLDGTITAGSSSINQAAITGESMPVAKATGDTVFAGSMNENGHLTIQVTKAAKDSTIARLIQMVEEAHGQKAETQRFIDKAEQAYAIGVIVITLLAIAIPLLFLQEAFDTTFYRAMTIMVAASPCAIVISTPATVLSAIGNGARRGILFKGGIHVENAATIKVLAFDKTGTLTIGEPQVVGIQSCTGLSENELLTLAASLEAKSEHPLAQAVVQAAEARELPLLETADFESLTGKGVRGIVNGRLLHIGSPRSFADQPISGWETAVQQAETFQKQGQTSIIMVEETAEGMQALGVIALADVVRPDAAEVIRKLKARGIKQVVMLTGDNRQVAEQISRQVGVDQFFAELLPEDKVDAIRHLQKTVGPVAMVGDGINDAPALATADLGIAMGAAGTDVALETADVVLMADNLQNVPLMIGLSRATRRTLMVNLGFALLMIGLMIAAIFFVSLPLPAAVIGHEGGTVLVSLNGLRMLGYRDRD